MSSKIEPAIWSFDAGQWIPCFDSCLLAVTWMSNVKDLPMVMVLISFKVLGLVYGHTYMYGQSCDNVTKNFLDGWATKYLGLHLHLFTFCVQELCYYITVNMNFHLPSHIKFGLSWERVLPGLCYWMSVMYPKMLFKKYSL